MGQPITVVETPSSSNPAILRLETNRPLSGMGHERYREPPSELLQRPVDELARRLFAAGGVERVHINGSVVTVTLGGGRTGAGLADIVRELFLHYTDTPVAVQVEPLDEADATPESLADAADAPAAQEAADDAPAPDRPTEDDAAAAEQEVPGIPAAEG
jgi:Scaffold protein Nfu/NifU N terminal